MKKTLSILLSILMIVSTISFIPLSALADDQGYCGDNAFYSYDSTKKKLRISGSGDMNNYLYQDPGWYEYRNEILSVEVANSVTNVGRLAFANMLNLKTVMISNSITSIDKEAFDGSPAIEQLYIGSNVTTIERDAFKSCSNLKDVYYPGSESSWNAITKSTGNDYLAAATMHYGFGTTGMLGANVYYVLDFCAGSLSVTGSGNINSFDTSSNKSPLYNCPVIKSVTIGNGITSLGQRAFFGCSNLSTISLSDSVTRIGQGSFESCGLTSVSIPNSVTTIADRAFHSCYRLETLSIGSGVSSISSTSFDFCLSLSSITVDENNTVFDSRDNCNAIIQKSTGKLVRGCNTTKIPFGTKIIGNSAFSGSQTLPNINIPQGVTTIEYGAFWNCPVAFAAVIPKSVTTIEENAFTFNKGLTYVYYGGTEAEWNNITINNTYGGNDDLLNANRTYNRGYIGESVAFQFNESNGHVTITGIGDMYDFDYLDLKSPFYDKSKYKTVDIQSGVTSVGNYAFSYSGITQVTMAETVTKIGTQAFSYCSGLYLASIPHSVTKIGGQAYLYCANLQNVNIGDGVQEIGAGAFRYCGGLSNVYIPESVTKIGTDAFDHANDHFTLTAKCNNTFAPGIISGTNRTWNKTHNAGTAQTEITVAPTCTKSGTGANVVYCSDCGAEMSRSAKIIGKLGHDWGDWTVTKDPQCTEAGEETRYCTRDASHFETRELPETGHNYTSKITETTSKTYTKTFTCTRCGDTYKAIYEKKANTLTVKAKTKTVKYKTLKKKNVSIARKNVLTVSKAKGDVTYSKSSGNKKITVSKAGKITVKKGLKKGTYKVKIKVKAKGTSTYKAKTKTVTVTIKVK